MYVTISNNTAAANTGRAQIYNATPLLMVEWLLSGPAASYPAVDIPHAIPLVVPTGYTIRTLSPVAAFFCTVTIAGYLF
jgi:hypothetical protein